MTSEPSFAYCEVVNVISHCCCERACAEVKRDLNRAGPVTIETLDHHCGAAQNQSLWQTELQHSQRKKKKFNEQRPVNPGKRNFHRPSKNAVQRKQEKQAKLLPRVERGSLSSPPVTNS